MVGWHHGLNGMNLSKLQEMVKDRGTWCAPSIWLQRVRQDLETEQPFLASLCSLEFSSKWEMAELTAEAKRRGWVCSALLWAAGVPGRSHCSHRGHTCLLVTMWSLWPPFCFSASLNKFD